VGIELVTLRSGVEDATHQTIGAKVRERERERERERVQLINALAVNAIGYSPFISFGADSRESRGAAALL
jgi:hypothetical protein